MWQGGKGEGGATGWNATRHLLWRQEYWQRCALHAHETHGWSETCPSNRLVISVTVLPDIKGQTESTTEKTSIAVVLFCQGL